MTHNNNVNSHSNAKRRHLLSTQDLSRSEIEQLLTKASQWIANDDTLQHPIPTLKNKTVANLFFENSTRTRCSFELAARRLGADVLNFSHTESSTHKGETLLDTVDNLLAMGVNVFVIRHSVEGVPALLAEHLGPRAVVINAGDGCHEHPTQALLDLLTIHRLKGSFAQLRVAITGDIIHSRVANSDIQALLTMGVGEIRLIGPPAFLPSESWRPNISLHTDLASGIRDVDVIMTLRIQKERIKESEIPHPETYCQQYGLSADKLSMAAPKAIVMHPGPMNRGIEIEDQVADGPQSVILLQASMGVAMRMAVLDWLVNA